VKFFETQSNLTPYHGAVQMGFLTRDALQCKARYCDCMLSVHLSVRRPSVCDVDGSGSHRLEILETNCMDNFRNIFALRSPKAIYLFPEEHGGIFGEVGWEKWRARAQKRQYLWNA